MSPAAFATEFSLMTDQILLTSGQWMTRKCNPIPLVSGGKSAENPSSMNRMANEGSRSSREYYVLTPVTASPSPRFQTNHLTPRTRSCRSTLRALAMRTRASTETVRCPFSSKETNTTDNPAFSANVSCVSFARLRCVRTASPRTRRCEGTNGTLNSNRQWARLTFTIV